MKKVCAIAAICSLLFLATPAYAQAPACPPSARPAPVCPGPTAGAPSVSVAPRPAPVCPSARAEQKAEEPQRGAEPKLGPYIGIGGSYAWENFDDVTVGATSVDLDDTWGYNARLGYQATPAAAFELEFAYIPGFDDTLVDLDVWTLMAVAKLYPPIQFPLKPFLAAGVGWMEGSADVTGGTLNSNIDDSDFAAKVGIGVDYYPVPAVSIGLEADYVFGFGDVDDIKYTNLMLGVAYHW